MANYQQNIDLVSLRRFEEARLEVRRATECDEPFGHLAEPWKTFAVLFSIECAVGNQKDALEARNRAIAAYLAYRRDGGSPQMDPDRAVEIVKQDQNAARAAMNDPDVSYGLAAEITLLLEGLNT